jgi:glucose/mannose-6-phosphate isomerase
VTGVQTCALPILYRKFTTTNPLSDNPAKQLAKTLYGRLPVIYAGGILSQVARRWKTEFNENSKNWAFFEVFPELDHNAICGYQFPQEVMSRMLVVMLHSSHLSERIQLRYRITREVLDKAKIDYRIVEGEGTSPLSQVMSTVFLGDYASYYLAILNGTQPLPTEAIDYLKTQCQTPPPSLPT